MTEKDWEDEAIEIVNERFGDDPGYSVDDARAARKLRDEINRGAAKIIMEDGTEFEAIDSKLERELADLEWHRLALHALRPFNIELEWAEVDAEVFDRMFADMKAEQRQYARINRIVTAIRDVFMITIGSLVIAMVLLARRAEQLINGENDE